MKPGFYISPGLLRVAGPLLALGACQIDVEAPPEGPRNASPVPSSSNWDDDHSHPDRGYDDPDPPRVAKAGRSPPTTTSSIAPVPNVALASPGPTQPWPSSEAC